MELELYFRLGTSSKRAMLKTKGRFGRDYVYRPRGDLLKRLSSETGRPIEAIYHQLQREREYLLRMSGNR
jgi:hypothetical protein